MLKELLDVFRSDDAIARMGSDFSKMVDLSHKLTVRAGDILFMEGESGAEELRDISKRDIKINRLERRIRRQLIAHLILLSDPGDVSYCVLLMSLVKDVERLGDYAKNVAEIRSEGGGPLPTDEHGVEIQQIRRAVEKTYGAVNQVFATSDTRAATQLIQEGREVNRRCDELITRVARSSYDAATTTTMVLAARYYKRIEAHLLNILSGVVMPLHKLDYFDEKVLEGVEDEDESL